MTTGLEWESFMSNIEPLVQQEGYEVKISRTGNDGVYFVEIIDDSTGEVVSTGEGSLIEAMTEAYGGTPERVQQ